MTPQYIYNTILVMFCATIYCSMAGDPPIVLEHRAEYDIREGEPLRIRCPVNGGPLSLVEWVKDDRALQRNDWEQRVRISEQTLRIKETVSSDAGIYTCTATNGFGSVVVQFIVRVWGHLGTSAPVNAFLELIDSQSTPHLLHDEHVGSAAMILTQRAVFMEPYPRNITANMGQNVSVLCRIGNRGKSPPSVKWYRLRGGLDTILLESVGPENKLTFKDDNLQQLISGTLLTPSTTDQTVFYSTLTLPHVTLTHTGWYICACRDTLEQFRSFFIQVTHDRRMNKDKTDVLLSSTSDLHSSNTGMTFLIIIISVLSVFGLLLLMIIISALCHRRKVQLRRSRDLLEKSLNGARSFRPEMERIRVPMRPGCEGMSAHCSPARLPGIGEGHQGPLDAPMLTPVESISYQTVTPSPQHFSRTDPQYTVPYGMNGTDATHQNKHLIKQINAYKNNANPVSNTTVGENSLNSLRKEPFLEGPKRFSEIYFEDNYTPLQNYMPQQRFQEQTLTYLAEC